MALICPQFHLTFYAGVWPAQSGAVSLLGEGDWVDEGSALGGMVEQLVQRDDYLRGDAPDFWVRGSETTSLEWTRVVADVPVDGSMVALAMDAAAALPKVTGWVLLSLPNLARQWVITPAVVRSVGWTPYPRRNELHLRYAVEKGVANEIATEAEEAALLLETGVEMLTEDGDFYLALETYEAP